MTRSYLITNDEGHSLLVHKLAAMPGEVPQISISSNDRACVFSSSMAEQLSNALLALKSGLFDRAVTETYLQIESARESRALRASENHLQPQIFSLTPSLDTL